MRYQEATLVDFSSFVRNNLNMKSIYLDYSATTQVGDAALNAIQDAMHYQGNPNSSHELGKKADKLIKDDLDRIRLLLNLSDDMEVIPVSGATEANNLLLRGAFERFSKKGYTHIITTDLEHSSINAPISALQQQGAAVDFVELNKDGSVDIDNLKGLIRDDTLLVSIGAINSETGIRQPIEEIGKLIKDSYPNVIFHTDATQAIGKVPVDYSSVDAVSLSAHKFYCLKGIGALIKKKNLTLIPQNKGGSSTTKFRAGTPCTELIHAMRASLEDAITNQDEKIKKITDYNNYLRYELSKFKGVIINSPIDAIPHILNISYLGHNADDIQKFMSDRGIYISTRTACASHSDMSATVLRLTDDEDRARSSIRISLSHKTDVTELKEFVSAFEEYTNGCHETD